MSEKDYRNELKKIFTGYKRLTPKIENSLAELGIFVARKRNHVVLTLDCGDIQKSVSISTTGSDKREGLNIVAKIMRHTFALTDGVEK